MVQIIALVQIEGSEYSSWVLFHPSKDNSDRCVEHFEFQSCNECTHERNVSLVQEFHCFDSPNEANTEGEDTIELYTAS